MLMILFIWRVDIIISSKVGVLDPTRLVLPPWGRTPSFHRLHNLTASAISSVEAGSKTKLDVPYKKRKLFEAELISQNINIRNKL